MMIFLASLAAVSAPVAPAPTAEAVTEISLRCLSFSEPSLELAHMDRKGKPVVFEARNQSLTHELRVPCKEQQLVIYRRAAPEKAVVATAGTDPAKAEPTWVPLATVALPPSGTRFIAIIHREGARDLIALIADPEDENAGGSMRFFNLCQHPVGLNFPGGNHVLEAGKDTVIHPSIQHEEYGQGQILSPGEGKWRLSGGIRWLQLNDIRTIWFILPTPGVEGTVMLRGIEERITRPAEATSPETARDATSALKAGLGSGKPRANGRLASSG